MRRYHIGSGILLFISILHFAVAAPVLVQEIGQAGVDVVHIPEDAIPILGKRGDKFDALFHAVFGDDHLPKPEESSSSAPLRPSNGWMDVEQPLPSIPEEPSPVSSPNHASPGPSNELGLNLFDHPEGHLFPSLSSPPSGLADGWTDLNQPLPSILKEPLPVSSPVYAPPSPGSLGYELMKVDTPPWPSGLASSAMSSADQESMGVHALPNPGPSTESDSEMMDVSPSSPVSSTNPEDEDSPSGKRRKTQKNWLPLLT